MPYRCLRCHARFDTAQPVCPADGGRLVRDRKGEILADRYVLQAPIGAGSTGSVVWDAIQTGIHRPVAVKILPAGDEEAHTRFARGAWLAARLDHEHIATIHDAGFTPAGESFLVMERLYGQPLSARIARGPVPVGEAATLLAQALAGLAHAHARQVVHCDLKPDNLFLDDAAAAHLRILDFGIARVPRTAEGRPSLNEIPGVDLSDGVAGTPRYMAPEQIR
ncbi:MAG: protein kinase, partial [Myxococcales bacterium]|nr:protein kinase [Myxococcales bacterium]